ncbi:MAG: four helix bundle protein [Patescibacteria group bacterium]
MTQPPFHNASTKPPPFGANSDIPIVQKLREVYRIWLGLLPRLPRLTRYTLGVKIDGLFTDTLELALLAGYASRAQKLTVIQRASTKLDALKFFLQLAWETSAIGIKTFATLAEILIEVGKMLGGWSGQLTKQNPA